MSESSVDADKAYLINVAETLRHSLLPALSGREHAQALDCLHTVTRVAAGLSVSPADSGASAQQEGRHFEKVEAEGLALLEEIEQLSLQGSRSIDQQQLQTFLRQLPQGGAEVEVTRLKLLPGGRSKLTALASLTGAKDLPGDLVVRQDWSGSVVDSEVKAEYEVLKRLADAGLKVPVPLHLEADDQALGAPFLVVTRLPGSQQGHLYTPPETAGPVLELAEQLGRMHALDTVDFEALPGIEERELEKKQLAENLAGFRGVIEKLQNPASTLVDASLGWLEDNLDHVTLSRSLVHGDCGFHNCLCGDDTLTAVLDWELVHLGNPALDLGYVRPAVEKRVAWDDFLARYQQAGGPEIDAFTLDWFTLYRVVWFHHMVLQARAGIMAGAVHDIDVAGVCAHLGPAALAEMSRRFAAVKK